MGHRANTQLWSAAITLKALANLSPGLALKPWEKRIFFEDATLKRVASPSAESQPHRNLQSCDEINVPFSHPGFQSKPWAYISPTLSALL
jgi:hypothetical protein